jgi:hypothetical protein
MFLNDFVNRTQTWQDQATSHDGKRPKRVPEVRITNRRLIFVLTEKSGESEFGMLP